MMILSDSIKNKIEAIRYQFPTEQALLIPLLHAIQKEHGWISKEAMVAAGEFLHLPLAKVQEVVTFYTMFNLEPVGKVHLQLCTNISCWLNGSEKLLHCLESRLGVGCGETTKDGNYTLSEVECLCAGGTAPVLQINDEYYESLDVPKLEALMNEMDSKLKQGAAANQLGKYTDSFPRPANSSQGGM
jgi:NADH-quinone oxidoreductase E subunit